MTSSRDPVDPVDPADGASPLTAEEESEVAALLAGAVGRDPVTPPPDVVSRLDDVLARLVEERSADRSPGGTTARERVAAPAHPVPPPAGGATVVPLEPRRRRLPRALLAAAAVVVGGYAVGSAVLGDSVGGGAGDGLAGSADSAGSATSGGGESASERERPGAVRKGIAAEEMPPPPVVRRGHLAADVGLAVRRWGRLPVDETRDCPVPRLTDRQRLYYVRYQGDPAGLVLGPRRKGLVDATVYSCLTGGVELSRPVPAP